MDRKVARALPFFRTYRREQRERLYRLIRPFTLYGFCMLVLLALFELYLWESPALAYFKIPPAALLLLTFLIVLAAPGTLRRHLVRIHWANLGLVSCAASAQLLWLYTAGGEASVLTVLVTAELVTAILCVLLIGYPYRSAAVLVAGVLYAAAASLALVLGQPGAAGWAPLLYPLPVLALAYLLAQIEEKLSFSEYHMRYSAERSRAKLQEQLGREEMLVKRLEETRAALEKEIEERKEVERGLERIAAFDELTSVYNRRAGLEVLKEAFHYARRNGLSLSVVFLDVDKLKYVNDNYGHGAGDEYLKEVVQTIRRHLRKSDSICRFGGDEFIVILTECRREKAMEIFTRIEEDLRDGEPRWGLEDLSFSYGTAEVTPEDEETAVDDLISLADKRMYIHKQWKKRS